MTNMRLVFLGPPGAGKGTQAERVSGCLGVPRVSTGDMLRSNIRAATPLGRQVQRYVEAGEHVPDALMVGMVLDRLAAPDCDPGFVLDGFPRTLPQAEALDQSLAGRGQHLDAVLSFDVDDEEIVGRLGGRLICGRCETIFQADTRPPQTPGVCDRCGGALHRRMDDDAETIRKRLGIYRAETALLAAYYQRRGLLHVIRASGPVAVVTQTICDVLPAAPGSRDPS